MRFRDQVAVGLFVLAAASSCSSAPGDAGAKGGAGGSLVGGAGGSAGGAAGSVSGAGGSAGGAAGSVSGVGGSAGGAGSSAGGAAGSTGGAGGTSDPNLCGARDLLGPHLRLSLGVAPSISYAYEGVATIEQSTNDELYLAYTPPESGQTDGAVADPDAGAPPMPPTRRVVIRGLAPMPLFPLGATIWLSVHVTRNPGSSSFYVDPWSIAVRQREGGTLLFGAALNPFASAPSPVPIGSPAADCVDPTHQDQCTNTPTTMTYQSLTVQGDTPVVIHDSQPGKISLGGVDYDVRLTARALGRPCIPTTWNQDGIGLDIQASDLASRVSGLDAGAPP